MTKHSPLSKKTPNQQHQKKVIGSATYSAPLPEASQFERYEATCEGAGQKIIDYMMLEQEGRHYNDKKLLDIKQKQTDNIYKVSVKNIRLKTLAIILGFVLIALMIGVSTFLIINNHEILGFIFGAPAIATVLYAFYSILKENKDQISTNNPN
ncbi:DUF2335 domain-containing protein [Francisella marina]|uniref:DUF2335 domain-containing protein n=1 Tax=Francisella marina TaxID=2249302 RepID=UPI0011EC1500|nr:DUF2335 domain-containing protein [Francisella marina]QEO58317.1 DUF2335 domain-containing protein [Francisella marina]